MAKTTEVLLWKKLTETGKLRDLKIAGDIYQDARFTDMVVSNSTFDLTALSSSVVKVFALHRSKVSHFVIEASTRLEAQRYENNIFEYGNILDSKIDSAIFNNCVFSHVNMDYVKIIETAFVNCVFNKCDFKYTTFTDCTFSGCHFIECKAKPLIGSTFKLCEFNPTNILGPQQRHAVLYAGIAALPKKPNLAIRNSPTMFNFHYGITKTSVVPLDSADILTKTLPTSDREFGKLRTFSKIVGNSCRPQGDTPEICKTMDFSKKAYFFSTTGVCA